MSRGRAIASRRKTKSEEYVGDHDVDYSEGNKNNIDPDGFDDPDLSDDDEYDRNNKGKGYNKIVEAANALLRQGDKLKETAERKSYEKRQSESARRARALKAKGYRADD